MRIIESLALVALALAIADGASAGSEQDEARREQSATRRSLVRARPHDGDVRPPGTTTQPEGVTGTVLYPDGTPAVGVAMSLVLLPQEEHAQPEVFSATSDASGAFVFPEALPDDEDWDLSVIAMAPGFALEAVSRSGEGGDRVEPFVMAFEPAQQVKLRFVDAGRAPVAGVTAFTMRRVAADGHDNYLPLAGASAAMKVSGADGSVMLEDFSPGDRVTLGIRPPGKAWEMRSFVADRSTELILAPAPNGGVAGSVRDGEGAPIVGADVLLVSTTWTGATTTSHPFATRTRGEGAFLTRDVCTLGERYGLIVTAAARGHAFESRETVQELGAAMGSVDFTLGPAVSLKLRVLDALGQPIVGARVCPASRLTAKGVTHAVALRAADRITRTTDDEGTVTLDCFASGDRATVEISRLGKPSTQLSFDVAGGGEVEIQVKP